MSKVGDHKARYGLLFAVHCRHALLITCLAACSVRAQTLLIRKVRPSAGDRIVIANTGSEPVDLRGFSLQFGDNLHRIDSTLILYAGGTCELGCGEAVTGQASGPPFKLPREGGTVLLIDRDGCTVLDAFGWNGLSRGEFLIRAPEGGTLLLADTLFGEALGSARGMPKAGILGITPSNDVMIQADPGDLWDPVKGIDVSGNSANHSRSGDEWSRNARLGSGDDAPIPATMRIAGSGSRSLAKRSFDVKITSGAVAIAGDTCRVITLRADAPSDAFLRNRFIGAVVSKGRCAVDVQPDVPVRLLINGRYHGLYRAMPKKNPDWIEGLAGNREVEVLEGPDLHVVRGGIAGFDQAYSILASGASLDEIAMEIDIESLIDLSLLDLYTGRADHDLNVRCWRRADGPCAWRWILFDMDLWTTTQENSLQRMLGDGPDDAPYLAHILANPGLRELWTRRTIAMLNTVLAPHNATALVDSLFSVHRHFMEEDHERWKGLLERSSPDSSASGLRAFVTERSAIVLEQLSRHLGMALDSVQVRCEPPGAGWIEMEGLVLTDDRATIQTLRPVGSQITVHAATGNEFIGWRKEGADPTLIPLLGSDASGAWTAVFRPAAWSCGNGLQEAAEQR